MNLHIVPDSKFINTFCNNLRELGILGNNKVIVRSKKKPTYVDASVPHAGLYSSKFDLLTGDTEKYDAVFIHLFSPLMYRWVATHSFRKLNWMVWGVDLYNLPFIHFESYDTVTKSQYISRFRPLKEWLYLLKVWITNMPFKNKAYSKVDFVLTWMKSEYNFAKEQINSLHADHKFFFYENQIPYQKLDERNVLAHDKRDVPSVIVGNSGYPTNNHLDAVQYMINNNIKADLIIPVSYGDQRYIRFLKKSLSQYKGGKILFLDNYMDFDKYVDFLSGADALVMNNIRPQGYGNVFMMLYMKKAVFLNEQNISIQDLRENGVELNGWQEMDSILTRRITDHNKEAISMLLSHQKLLNVYQELFF